MIKHIVAFRFKAEVSVEEKYAVLEELNEFPKRWPAMRRWSLGRNISKRDNTFTHAFVVEFETEQDLLDYLNSDEHERYVRERWRLVIEQRAILSYEF